MKWSTLQSLVRLKSRLFSDLMHIGSPITGRDKFNLDRGSILGLAHDFFNVLACESFD